MRWETARRRAWLVKTPAERHANTGHAGFRRVLSLIDLTFLGLGSIIGAGVYVLSGVTAKEVAGPSVIVSYLVASVAALLAALCYTEFAVDLPITGGAFNYISVTFGELAAWSVGWNMILETLLSSSAVARGFSGYLCTLVGIETGTLLFEAGPLRLDPLALGLIALLTAVLAKGTRESSTFNITVCSINLSCIAFVLVLGLPLGRVANLTPFSPFGLGHGTFAGASILFFAFVGFDYIANVAEEVSNPTRDLPIGILTSLGVATILYALMAAALVLMVPYAQVDVHAPFSAAFAARGMHIASRVISAGAVAGIVTSTMTGLLSQARLFVVLGREALLPKSLAQVRSSSNTPATATIVTGAAAGFLALLLDINTLAELVSVGTLYVFCIVCAAVIFRRCHVAGQGSPTTVLSRLGALAASSLATSVSYTFGAPTPMLILLGILWTAALVSLYLLPVVHPPTRFAVPLFPLTPSLGILATVHLLCSLGWPAYVRFVAWMSAGVAVYVLYGANAAEQQDMQLKWRRQEPPPQPQNGGLQLVQRTLSGLEPEGPIIGLAFDERERNEEHSRLLQGGSMLPPR